MELDMDEILNGLMPWDFSVRIAGKSYPTRPLTVADVVRLEKAFKENNPESLRTAIQSVFSTPLDLSLFPHEATHGIAAAVSEYWREHILKNSPAIAPAIKAAMAKMIAGAARNPSGV
jgi:hypothetical protein